MRLNVKSYADDIKRLGELLNDGRFPSVRSLFSKSFLAAAQRECASWARTMPSWYAFYAQRVIAEQLRLQRIEALELVLSSLRGVPGSSNCRKSLERRVKDGGFAASEAFFETMVIAAGLSLRPHFTVEIYPQLPSGRPEFSVSSGGRPTFFEATCFKLQGKSYLRRFGEVLTSVRPSPSRLKSKFQQKSGQLPRNSPNVLVVGHMGFNPAEDPDLLAETIVHGAREHFVTGSLAAVLVLWYSTLSDPVIIRTEYFNCGGNALSGKEREVVERLKSCFRARSV